MRYITRIIIACLIMAVIGNTAEAMAVDESPKHVLLAEVSPEAKDSASKEYVVLYNPNTFDIDVSGWLVQYRSASHKSDDQSGWVTKAIIGCQSTRQLDCAEPVHIILAAGETLRLSSYETGDRIMPLASGMATSGGEVRLVKSGGDGQQDDVEDMVGYGTAQGYEGDKAAPAPKAGQSIVRLQDDQEAYVDTGHNNADFILSPNEDVDSPAPSAGDEPLPQPGQGAGTPQTSYKDADITELMPDPASPQTDTNDEFIELYNPYDQALDLTGYTLKTGTNWTYKYTITETVVDPFGYIALTSAQTHLSLSNSGSGVRLYDPAGNLLSEAPSYGKARTGDSWAKNGDGQWAWTTKPTPGEANILEAPTGAVTAAKTSTSSSTKKTTATKAASSTKKAATPKSGTSAVKGLATTASQPAAASNGGNQIGMWVLAGAGLLGVGYALYEYRQEIGGFMRRRWEAVATLGRKG